MNYLRDSAERYGTARGHQAYCDANMRRVKALELLGSDGTLGEREAKAYASETYKVAMGDLQNATAEVETIRAKREAAVFTIEVWRSANSARKQGLIT